MQQIEVCGKDFVKGVDVHERSDSMCQYQMTQVKNGPQYKAWVCMRRPFLLPTGLVGHDCGEHWEKFDVDKAACKVCSKLHVCNSHTCTRIIENDGLICDVTGLFLGQRLIHVNDFPHTAENYYRLESSPSTSLTSDLGTDVDSITRVLKSILASKNTQKSIDNETGKLLNKLRMLGLRRMRQYRMMKRIPNLCDIDAYLHQSLSGHRIPPPSVSSSDQERNECITLAALSISRLIAFMRTHCTNIPSCVKQGGVVVGMLYMMRTGVTIDNITVLPRISQLKRLLPLEQHLPTFFNVRAKVVTEAENVIKYNMRGVHPRNLALLAQTQCITRSK
jgi:hypothetical protein